MLDSSGTCLLEGHIAMVESKSPGGPVADVQDAQADTDEPVILGGLGELDCDGEDIRDRELKCKSRTSCRPHGGLED